MSSYEIDFHELRRLHQLIAMADYSVRIRLQLLHRLRFISGNVRLREIQTHFMTFLDRFLDPLAVVIITIIILCSHGDMVNIIFMMMVFLVGYVRWMRAQRNANVTHALNRKDKANAMIVEFSDLLFEFTGNVFGIGTRNVQRAVGTQAMSIVDMYVFTEIDNLEFVYNKSRANLIEDEYVVRAIKIFIARSENIEFFRVARKLIYTGRYNREFQNSVVHLLYVSRTDVNELNSVQ